MRDLKVILKLELGRSFKRKSIITLVVFFVLMMGLLHVNVLKYKQFLKDIDNFKVFEKEKVSRLKNFEQYGDMGIRCIQKPNIESVFFYNAGALNDIIMRIDLYFILSLDSSASGKSIFNDNSGAYMDFPGIVILFGGLIAILFGSSTFKDKEYYRFLVSVFHRKRLFFMVALSRIIILFIVALLFILLIIAYMVLTISGLTTTVFSVMVPFTGTLLVTLLFFFCLGLPFGMFRNINSSKIFVLILWSCIVFLMPMAISKLMNINVNSIPSNMTLDLKKWNKIQEFEKKAFALMGKYTPEKAKTEGGKAIYKLWFDTYYVEIRNIENETVKSMQAGTNLYHSISSFFPGAFYFSVTRELSSKGYQNIIDFQRFSAKLKDAFFRWYMNIRFFQNDKKFNPFIEGEAQVFKSRSQLPATFGLGMVMMLFYSLLLTGVAYRKFGKYLYDSAIKEEKRKIPGPGETIEEETPKSEDINDTSQDKNYEFYTVDFKENSYQVIHYMPIFKDYLYNVISGKSPSLLTGKIDVPVYYHSNRLDKSPQKLDFLYMCSKEEIPGDIRVKDFFNLLMQSARLPQSKIAEYEELYNIDTIGNARFDDISDMFKFRLVMLSGEVLPNSVIIINEQLENIKGEGYQIFHRLFDAMASSDRAVLVLRTIKNLYPSSIPRKAVILNYTDNWDAVYKKSKVFQ